MTVARLARRLGGGLCLTALLAVGACGGDDDTSDAVADDTTTTTAAPAPTSCADRVLAFAERPDVVEAARTGAEDLPAAAEAESEAIDDECGDELDAMTTAELTALFAEMDPDVLNYLGEPEEQEFEKVGEAITGQ